MKPTNPQLIDALAGQYVLGTLRGPARRRLARWTSEGGAVRESVQRWEDRLMPLTSAIPAAEPSPHVWTSIRRRIRDIDAQPPESQAARPMASRGPWQWALAASLLIAALAVFWYGPFRTAPLRDIGNVTATNGQVLWHVAVNAAQDTLHIQAIMPDPRTATQDYELWALSPTGGAPVSLGVMPAGGELTRSLNAAQRSALLMAAQIAVTLEQRGGSPTGAPMGPVVHVNAVQRAG
ncbi:MAG TPA: anti-sigma factor [Steroidobacteraceae bacterium]|nr:anti-sigma factor [Steroidobacteraceae bacterium]